MSQKILYLGALDKGFVQEAKLAGIRRYAAARRWEVVPVPKAQSIPSRIPDLLKQHRPLGCIVEFFGGDRPFLKPGLFGPVPTVYLDMPNGLHRRLLGRIVSVDDEAVARAALRELAAVRPASVAAVEFEAPLAWSRLRARAFRSLAEAEGHRCSLFSARHGEEMATRATRLAEWVSSLPRPCGVFAVNDVAASEVRTACRAARLHIPRDISIVGVDNDAQICEAPEPTLTSIQIDFERAGFLAAKMLGTIISHRGTETRSQGKHTDLPTPNGVHEEVSRVSGEQIRMLNKDLCDSVPLCDKKHFAVGPLMAVRRKSTSGRGRHEPRIMEAMEIIRRDACNGLTAEKLIARFPGTRRLFDIRFREATGHSVLDEILHVRLEQACTLLSQTDTAIGAIADFCGFDRYQTLDKLFRKRFRMSMRQWRRQNSRLGL
jgi:LacI family transcriptional regulator